MWGDKMQKSKKLKEENKSKYTENHWIKGKISSSLIKLLKNIPFSNINYKGKNKWTYFCKYFKFQINWQKSKMKETGLS
jgi:hypothetical protein